MKSNFEFLNKYWETLAKIGETAESYLYNDPNACIYKLGMFAERLVQEIFANESLEKLRTITFVFDEKKKPKRKYVRKNVKQCVDKNSDDDIKDNPIESETAIVNDRKETESEPKIDNRDDEEYIGDDGIGYQEYTGEDMPDDEENKVDYLEQLKNQ